MRLDNFIKKEPVITEKVNKSEITEALNNRNIYIGAEFEFIIDDAKTVDTNQNDMYSAAMQDYTDFEKEMAKALKEKEDEDRHRDDLYSGIIDAEQELETAEDKVSELEDELEAVQNKLDDLDDTDPQYKRNFERLSKSVKMTENSLKIAKRDAEKTEDDLKDLKEELSGLEDDMYSGIYIPSVGKDYIYYAESYLGMSSNYWDDLGIKLFYDETNDELEEPPEPEYSDSNSDIEASLKDSGALGRAPFTKYEFGDYGSISQGIGSSVWAIEDDPSLSSGGCEIKSPPMKLPEFMKILPKMFSWIHEIGSTDSTCGFHVHMSIAGVNDLEGVLDPLKLILFTDEDKIWKYFDERGNNNYTKSMKDKLKTSGGIQKSDIASIFDIKKLKTGLSAKHYDSISLTNMSEGHIEFRHMGGTGYQSKFSEIKEIIGMHAYNLSLACDENFKKKEYTLKLVRIFNKIDMYSIIYQLKLLKDVIDGVEFGVEGAKTTDVIELKSLRDRLNKDLSKMRSIYKEDSKSRNSVFSNVMSSQSAERELSVEIKKVVSPDTFNIMLRHHLAVKV